MNWIILFFISWVLLLLLLDWRKLTTNIWSGFSAVVMQVLVDKQFIFHKLYEVNDKIVDFWESSLFFVFGPVFVIGILYAQFHPVKRWEIVTHVLIISLLFSLEELFLLGTKDLVYINWHYINSMGINLAAMIVLSWISIVFLNKRSEKDI